jgi:hypothetical protein
MADQKELIVTQNATESSSLRKDTAQPIEPVYTVPPEQQTQFEACDINPATP